MMEEEDDFQEDFVDTLIRLALEHESAYLPGDRFYLFDEYGSRGMEVLEMLARENPEDEERVQIVARLRVPLDSSSLEVMDDGEVKVEFPFAENCISSVVSATSSYRDVEVVIDRFKWYGHVVESGMIDGLWERCQNSKADYGVHCEVGEVPDELRASLQRGIDLIASNEPPDYHPNTNRVVRDFVHPSLFPYIEGVSKLTGKGTSEPVTERTGQDFWGRPYEDSIYQWLPAQFFVDENGKCSIRSYINNLPKEKYSELYGDLERLFELFLPYFEEVCQCANWMGLSESESGLPELRNRELQVVVKIVDYEFTPQKSFEGVWHVEGMSHENIVSTGLYVIERSQHIVGGDLLFKRPFTEGEVDYLQSNMPQSRHPRTDEMVDEGLVPVGKLKTQEGAMIVFPNSHVHKVDLMYNSAEDFARRRIIVFFLVNPMIEIVSSRDVPPQQNVIPREEALEHRLRLMEERKRHKQDWNIRPIELCEH